MLISLVIPAFEQQQLLNYSLDSIAPQRRHLHEIIVVDDGSRIPLQVPSWVKIHRIDRNYVHRGSSAAKNIGAEIATGDYLMFSDADILHMPDAVTNLRRCMQAWIDAGKRNVLLNTMRVSLPKGYPIKNIKSVRGLLKKCRTARLLVDEPMLYPQTVCYEQNEALINRAYFLSLGGYDEDTFRLWGFNNQDLCLRVWQSGGSVSSAIASSKTGKRQFCFHIWHDADRSRWHADKEFESKYGEPFSEAFVKQWRDNVQDRAVPV